VPDFTEGVGALELSDQVTNDRDEGAAIQ
jgi:hypothetical protein